MAVTAATTARMGDDQDFAARVWAWIQGHRQASTYGGLAIVAIAGLLWWNHISTRQSEERAGTALNEARLAFETKNFPLASSELSSVVANYSGTRAAQEATILLAQIRLLQGQSQQAIEQLKAFAPSADAKYRAQAYGLLGAAYDNVGHPREAAEAYAQAAAAAPMDFLTAQFLSDAGRAWVAAGDTTKAIAAYQSIVTKYDSLGTAMEAKVRLGELTRGAWKAPAK
ncbi:MAG TPA: tetratricopeptide repeat protein [Gemmatimonadales bacterium]|nr:tetratricopeptide repeat protein [Gemmatimonadales bacterium]